eukprot:2174405-Prorocentrum_lima.AAC.1
MTVAEAEGTEPASRRMGKRSCPPCELDCRKNEWPQLTESERTANPNYCTHEQVAMDMKSMNRKLLGRNSHSHQRGQRWKLPMKKVRIRGLAAGCQEPRRNIS